ncbi:MAG: hypothetical protein P8X77_04465 [Maritimibacter sp.]
MSDPVSATEIEDVLTSIRRLVLENANAQPRPDVDLPAKLVLTPAFRIDEADQETAAKPDHNVVTLSPKMRSDDSAPKPDESENAEQDVEAAAEMTQSGAAAPDQNHKPDSLELRIAELEAAVDECIVDFEPDGSETPDIPERMIMWPEGAVADGAEAEAPAEQVDAQLVAEVDAPETAQEPLILWVRADEGEVADAGEAAVDTEVAPDSAVDEVSDAGEEHRSLLHALAKAREAVSAAKESHDREKAAWVSASADAVQVSDAAEADDDVAEAELSDEGSEEFDDATDWEDVGPSVGSGHLHFQSHPGSDEDVLDEDTLREMVSQMLREELQGEIGERITHNVRRMVRREIARALSLQGVE